MIDVRLASINHKLIRGLPMPIAKGSLVCKLPSYERTSMVSVVIMSSTEAAIAVGRWEESREVTVRERVNSGVKRLSGVKPCAFTGMVAPRSE